MRDHIRREAGQFEEAVWWLVPIAFATAALAAVVLSGKEPADETMLHASAPQVVNMPNAASSTVGAGPAMVTPAVATPAAEVPTLEETERVPTF